MQRERGGRNCQKGGRRNKKGEGRESETFSQGKRTNYCVKGGAGGFGEGINRSKRGAMGSSKKTAKVHDEDTSCGGEGGGKEHKRER